MKKPPFTKGTLLLQTSTKTYPQNNKTSVITYNLNGGIMLLLTLKEDEQVTFKRTKETLTITTHKEIEE